MSAFLVEHFARAIDDFVWVYCVYTIQRSACLGFPDRFAHDVKASCDIVVFLLERGIEGRLRANVLGAGLFMRVPFF